MSLSDVMYVQNHVLRCVKHNGMLKKCWSHFYVFDHPQTSGSRLESILESVKMSPTPSPKRLLESHDICWQGRRSAGRKGATERLFKVVSATVHSINDFKPEGHCSEQKECWIRVQHPSMHL